MSGAHVSIRLARFGRRNEPFYNIVIGHSRSRRSKPPIEVIGTYDPLPKLDPYQINGKPHKNVQLDFDRARYWVGVGAQPTNAVWKLFSMLGILEPKPYYGAQPEWDPKARPILRPSRPGEPVMPPRPATQVAGRP